MYYTYILRCKDKTLYTGITTDLERRLAEHKGESLGGAKYTRGRGAVMFEAVWSSADRVLASKLEFQIKKLPKAMKEELITNNNLKELLGEKVDTKKYRRQRKLLEKL